MGTLLAFIGLLVLAVPVAFAARALFRPPPGGPPHESDSEIMGRVEAGVYVALACLGAAAILFVGPAHPVRSVIDQVECAKTGLDLTDPDIYDRRCTQALLAAGKGTVTALAVRGVGKLGYWKLTVERMKADPQSASWIPVEDPGDVMVDFMRLFAPQAVPVDGQRVMLAYQVAGWKFESSDELPNMDMSYCFAFVRSPRAAMRQSGSNWIYETPALTRGIYCGSVLDAVSDANIGRVLGALQVKE